MVLFLYILCMIILIHIIFYVINYTDNKEKNIVVKNIDKIYKHDLSAYENIVNNDDWKMSAKDFERYLIKNTITHTAPREFIVPYCNAMKLKERVKSEVKNTRIKKDYISILNYQLETIYKDSISKYKPYKSYTLFRHELDAITKELDNIKAKDDIKSECKDLINSISAKHDLLKSNDSESMFNTATEIYSLYSSVDDLTYKDLALSQIKAIDEYLDNLVDAALIPGTQAFIKNELKIKEHYINSIIPKKSMLSVGDE